MLTTAQLRDLVHRYNVEALAREANVSTKTIYRLRWGSAQNPGLKTIEKIVAASKRLKPAKAKVAA